MSTKKNLARVGLAVALAMTMSAPALAGKAGEFTIGADAEYFWPDRVDTGVEKGPGGRLSFGYRFTDEWGIRASYAQHNLETDTGIVGFNEDVDVDSYRLEAQYFFNTTNDIQPYLSFGGQQIDKIDVHGGGPNTSVDDDVDPELTLGAGVRYYFNKNFSLNAGGNISNDFGSMTDVSFGVGLAVHWGGTEDMPPPAACTDADADGVCDNVDQCPGTPAGVQVDATGCPATMKENVSIELKVLFDYDKSVVKDEYSSELQKVADFMKEHPDTKATIEGHTDSRGSDEYNQGLSERRANAVKDKLVSGYGVDASRLDAVGYGEARPVADNSTDEGRAENRRVVSTIEITVEKPKQ